MVSPPILCRGNYWRFGTPSLIFLTISGHVSELIASIALQLHQVLLTVSAKMRSTTLIALNLSSSSRDTADSDFVSKGLLQVNTLALGISWLTSILLNPFTCSNSLEIWTGNPVVKAIFAKGSHETYKND